MADLKQIYLKLQQLGLLPLGDLSRIGASEVVQQLRNNPALHLLEFDCESIENKWDYPRLLRDLLEPVGEQLDIRRVRCTLDRERGLAQLTFQCQGENVDWTFPHQSDWVSDDFINNVFALVRDKAEEEMLLLPTSDQFVCVLYFPKKMEDDS